MYNVSFKKMAVGLSDAKGSVKAAAVELGVDPGRISKWGNQYKINGNSNLPAIGLSEEQKRNQEVAKRTQGGAAGA